MKVRPRRRPRFGAEATPLTTTECKQPLDFGQILVVEMKTVISYRCKTGIGDVGD